MNEDMRHENVCPQCNLHRRLCSCDLAKGMGAKPIPVVLAARLIANWRHVAEFFASRNWPDTILGRAAHDLHGDVPKIAAAIAHAEAVAKDAERYRHMRDRDHPLERVNTVTKIDNGTSCYQMVQGIRELKHGAELDAAIDAAITTGKATE